MLLLNYLVSRKHYEILLVEQAVIDSDKCPHVVEVCVLELETKLLFDIKHLQLHVVYDLLELLSPLQLLLIQLQCHLFVCWVLQIGSEQPQVLLLLVVILLLQLLELLVFLS